LRRGGILAVCAVVLACVLPGQAAAAGPSAVAVDSDGTTYAGFASGAITRVSASGSALPRWTTPVGDANGSLGPIMAIDVGASESNPNGRNVWILDANRRVQEFTRDGVFVRGFSLDACDGSNVPEPAREGGIAVTHDQIYVAHPCANRIYRYTIASLPASGTSAAGPVAQNTNVHAPHGIAGPDSSIPTAQYHFLYVAQPKDEAIRWFDPVNLTTPPAGNPIPCLTKAGPTEDVYLLNSANTPRIYFADTANNDLSNANRIFAAEATFETAPFACQDDPPVSTDRPFNEIFHLGRPDSGAGSLQNPVAFDVFATTAPASTNVIVADRGGTPRIQRRTAGAFDNDNLAWTVRAEDPGPPPVAGGGGTGGSSSGGGTAGGTTGGAAAASGGASGAPAITINDGAAYTRTPEVLLEIREPAGTTSLEISNSASFTGFEPRGLQASRTYGWTLETEGSDRVPKRVSVRFPGATGASSVFDEITLDRRAPLVGDPTVQKRRKKGKKPRWLLSVPASDEVSGVDSLEYGPERDGDFKSRAFKSPLRLEDRSDAVYVRVTDVAGNVSGTKRVLRTP
jgi:hypothetical protein